MKKCYFLLWLWSLYMPSYAETSETPLTPENNKWRGVLCDVRFDRTLSTNMCWTVVFVDTDSSVVVAKDLYLQIWDDKRILGAFSVSETDSKLVPHSIIKVGESGQYFLIKLSESMLMASWGAILVNNGDEHMCVIRFRDWITKGEKGPVSESGRSINY